MHLASVPDENPTLSFRVGVGAHQPLAVVPDQKTVSCWKRVSPLGLAGTVTAGLLFAIAITLIMWLAGAHIPPMLQLSLTDMFWLSIFGLLVAFLRDFVIRRHNSTIATINVLDATKVEVIREDLARERSAHQQALVEIRRQMAYQRTELTARLEEQQRVITALFDRLPGYLDARVEQRVTDAQADEVLRTETHVPEQRDIGVSRGGLAALR